MITISATVTCDTCGAEVATDSKRINVWGPEYKIALPPGWHETIALDIVTPVIQQVCDVCRAKALNGVVA